MELTGKTKIHDLLVAHPFLEDFLASYNAKFEMLRNRMARSTIGRVATLRTAAGIASLDLDTFLQAIATEIEQRTGERPRQVHAGEEAVPTREQRVQELKGRIGELHDGGDLSAARERFAKAAAQWPAGSVEVAHEGGAMAQGLLGLATGELTLDQVNLILTHLPVDLSFVDENDTVRFYSEGPQRIFPRSPAVIGRKVQNCHPPKSVHVVQEILDSFRAGTQSVADFWIQLSGRFVQIRYLAVRDKAGIYRGCLEVSQDVTEIRKLEGEQRLLDWTSATP